MAPNILVVVIEGLSANLISAFGSTIAKTPTIDRLAAWGLVLDQCYVDGPELPSNLKSLWTGMHAMQSSGSPENTLWRILERAQVPCSLFTDSQEVAEEATVLGCQEPIVVRHEPKDSPAESTDDCSLMQLFASVANELEDEDRNGLVWLHSSGLHLPWDAPIAIRQAFADPDDPPPPSGIEPPGFQIDANTDPDELTGWLQVAAAQVAAFDEAIEGLRAAIENRSDAESWHWCILAPGGISLGEMGYFGIHDETDHIRSNNELTAPVIFCPQKRSDAGTRRSELYQLPDVFSSLLDLFRIDAPTECWGKTVFQSICSQQITDWPKENQLVAMQAKDQKCWIRSPAWSASIDDDACSLYVMPDDRWQTSDVANLRIDVCELMRSSWSDFVLATKSNKRGALPELPSELTNLIR